MTKAVIIEIKRDHNNTHYGYSYVVLGSYLLKPIDDRTTSRPSTRHTLDTTPPEYHILCGLELALQRGDGARLPCASARERAALARRATEAEPTCYSEARR